MIKNWIAFGKRYANVIFFVGGFLFDAITLVRIDSVLDLSIQAFYLLGITVILVIDTAVKQGRWTPRGRLEKLWELETEVIHFFYGGLLSSYVVFYFKSTTFSRSFIFFCFIALLMFANEMPQVRKVGAQMRLGLYAFCILSFLNYLVPVIIGRMGAAYFLISWILSVLITYKVIEGLSRFSADKVSEFKKLFRAPVAIFIIIPVFYFLKLIPPVPLSLKYIGIYHQVERSADQYVLTYQKPAWYRFWRKDDRLFLSREGDNVYCFFRIFAPRRFTHQILSVWKKKDAEGNWVITDTVPLNILGGKDDGFRGFTKKISFEPGKWHVDIEANDGRALGGISFMVQPDTESEPRVFLSRRM